MQYCEYCKINIRDNKKLCPLCQNSLPGYSKGGQRIFPDIAIKYDSHLALKILIFLSIAITVISFVVYMFFPVNFNWPIYVLATIICIWVILAVAIRKRNSLSKSMIWQVGVISLIVVFWDLITGFRGWSLNYGIPMICVAAMVVLFITAKIMKLSPSDYLFYLLLDVLYGFVPIAFILLGWVDILYPSIICIAVSIISLSALLLFQGNDIKRELKKRMHI